MARIETGPVATPWRNRIVGHGEEAPDQLLANPRNWRIHPKAQQDALSGVLDEVGWVKEVIVNRTTGHVVDGHLRVSLAISREEPTIPVAYVELSPEQEALVLATLDPLMGMASEAKDALESLLADVTPASEAVAGLLEDVARGAGLSTVKEGLTDPDAVPEPPEESVSKRGDVRVCGDHRVMCGDSTVEEDVSRLMAGEKAAMVFADPPYGVDLQERDMQQAEVRGRRKDGKGIENDDLTGDALQQLLTDAFEVTLSATSVGACWYVCAPSGVDYRRPLNVLADLGVARHGIVWVKDRFVMGRADYHYRHENIIYGWTPGAAHHAVPTRDQDSVWEFVRPARSPEHPAMKPVALVERAIGNSSAAGEVIYDPFLGSGTTMIAAERLGRRCYGMEIEPRYVDVAVHRWEEFTGRKAEHLHKTEAVSA